MTHFLPTTRRKCADFTFQTFIFFLAFYIIPILSLFILFSASSVQVSHDACDPFNDHCHK